MATIAHKELPTLTNVLLAISVLVKQILPKKTVTYAHRAIIVRQLVSMQSLLNVKRVSTAQLDSMSQDQKHTDVQRATTAQQVHMKKLHALQDPTCHISMEHYVTLAQEVTTV
jgi:glutathionyl-hydroquinone reductase